MWKITQLLEAVGEWVTMDSIHVPSCPLNLKKKKGTSIIWTYHEEVLDRDEGDFGSSFPEVILLIAVSGVDLLAILARHSS